MKLFHHWVSAVEGLPPDLQAKTMDQLTRLPDGEIKEAATKVLYGGFRGEVKGAFQTRKA